MIIEQWCILIDNDQSNRLESAEVKQYLIKSIWSINTFVIPVPSNLLWF